MGAWSSYRISYRSTTKICRPELPFDRRNMMDWEPSNRRMVKGIHGENQRGDRIREGKIIKEMCGAHRGIVKRRL
jgi:hypothetical protein